MRESRIEQARRRAAGAKRVVLASAVAGFLGLVVVVRAGHPGHAATTSGSTGTSGASRSSTQSSSDDDNFDFGSSSVTPSSSPLQIQTSVS